MAAHKDRLLTEMAVTTSWSTATDTYRIVVFLIRVQGDRDPESLSFAW